MAGRVAGRNIVITGGAGGLGLAIARLAAAEGAAVGVIDMDGARAADAALQLAATGVRAIGAAADVSKSSQAADALRRIQDALGNIDGLVNNAGVAELGSVHDTDERSWRRVIEINVDGVFLVSKLVLPGMMQRGQGVILNIASIAGLVGIRNMAAYCASKGAIIGLTRQMAVDYAGCGIRINALAPGTISTTEMGARLLGSDLTPEARARRLARYPMGRFAVAEEIARAALFLLSEDSSFATGSILTVDGGLTAV